MTSDYGNPDDSKLTSGLAENRVKRFQAALAIQISLMTGRRIGEVLALEAQLGHHHVGLAERYLRSSKRVESEADNAVDLAELCAFYTAGQIPRAAGGARDKAGRLSPFSRVHEDFGRIDALSAHLSALREQLSD
ncbi:Tyr recombinase domain-containing protein [Paraburkholderia kururiensis]|uniref:hypothetical protein n=1 Tax=Paraburkholderia kururiensis TaxID=984307 RepID=UPI0039A73FF0